MTWPEAAVKIAESMAAAIMVLGLLYLLWRVIRDD